MIRIIGAREHNLKNINVDIPREKLTVITGLSGSGKSSLAFDTIYAEGQRRYVESLSAYARQFLGQLEKPDVDSIEGLSPAISIQQKTTHRNPRSTVGTVTEIYDYMKLIFARIGKPKCPNCKRILKAQSIDSIIDQILDFASKEKINVQVLAPIVKNKKGEHKYALESLSKEGFVRVRVDGDIYSLDDEIKLEKNKKHSIEIVVDRLVLDPEKRDNIVMRLTDSMELALQKGNQQAILLYTKSVKNDQKSLKEQFFSTKLACLHCDIYFPEITHRLFSFNSPEGACSSCSGLGASLEFHPKLIINDAEKTISEGVFAEGLGWSGGSYYRAIMNGLQEKYHFSLDTPWKKLSSNIKKIILYGTGKEKINFKWENHDKSHIFQKKFEGIIPNLRRRYETTFSDAQRQRLDQYMVSMNCNECKGKRLKPEALSIFIHDKHIWDICSLSIKEAWKFFNDLKLNKIELQIAKQALKEINSRLGFLENVGLGYLNLSRMAGTLSGGEAQRIRLATQIGSALMGVLYVLDEPSIGLHQSDNKKLIDTLKNLRDIGNTIIVVEHDEETIQSADHIVDIGPRAGLYGGNVIHNGDYTSLLNNDRSITGQYLSNQKKIEIPSKRRKKNNKVVKIFQGSANNLKKINVEFPLGIFICVTGLSGSGKSTLVNEILYKGLASYLHNSHILPGAHKKITGLSYIDKVIDIDQSPIGRTPRSNPATYTGAFTSIRELFANLPSSKMRGYKPGRFSFNVSGGRCEACEGDGLKRIEMHFLPDVYVTCEICKGKRYNRETLEMRFKGKNIHDVLEMSVEEGLQFFDAIFMVKRKLKAMYDVGLGYIKIGQPATTLSGGEAQRVKLASELSKKPTGKTLYILDEPTTGLHFEDINQLLKVLHQFVDHGNTVVVIEHNMDVIKTADWIIDLGPGGGEDGGRVVAQGNPEKIIFNSDSMTGNYLKKWLVRDQ